jgi:integrase
MSKKFLTDTLLKSLTSGDKAYDDVWDTGCPGLIVRVYARKKDSDGKRTGTARKSWFYGYTSKRPGESGSIKLSLNGTYPTMSLIKAREATNKPRELVEQGQDPRDQRPDPVAGKTIKDVVLERLADEVTPCTCHHQREDHAAILPGAGKKKIRHGHCSKRGCSCGKYHPKQRKAEDAERRALKNIIPKVGHILVSEFRPAHVHLVTDPFKLEGKLRTVGVLYQDLNTLIHYARKRGYIEFSRIEKLGIATGNRKRKRFLENDEITIVWNLLPTVFKNAPKVELILKLCLLLGKRLNEVCAMTRAEINQETRIWVIPPTRFKSKNDEVIEADVVPFSEQAWAIVSELLRTTNGDWLFPDDDGDDHYHPHVVGQRLRIAQMPKDQPDLPYGRFGLKEHFTAHDTRRTCSTHLLREEFGVREIIVDAILNHRSKQTDGEQNRAGAVTLQHYNGNKFIEEKRRALQKWANHIDRLTSDGDGSSSGDTGNVIDLRVA